MNSKSKPLVFLDVDGVLNRSYSIKRAEQEGARFSLHACRGIKWSLCLTPSDYENLLKPLEVYAELAWGTTWEDDANLSVRFDVGIPHDLLVAKTRTGDPEEAGKAAGILRAANGRPFVWFDDDIDPMIESWLRRNAKQPYLLVKVEDRKLNVGDEGETGLTRAHIVEALSWLSMIDVIS